MGLQQEQYESSSCHPTSQRPIEQMKLAEKGTVTAKAVKSDNAEIPEHLWNRRVAEGIIILCRASGRDFQFNLDHPKDRVDFERGLRGFRMLALRVWKRNICVSFWRGFRVIGSQQAGLTTILKDGLQACEKAMTCSWWTWDKGLAIFFWRWPSHYQVTVRIGITPYFDTPPPLN